MSNPYTNSAMQSAIQAIMRKFDENGKDFLSFPLDWQKFLTAIIVRKRGVARRGATVFSDDFMDMITPEKHAKISEILSCINELFHVMPSGSGFVDLPNCTKMQYVYPDYVADFDLDSRGLMSREPVNTYRIPRDYVRNLIDSVDEIRTTHAIDLPDI